MKVYRGLKNAIRNGNISEGKPTQGSIMYSLVMRYLSRQCKPHWMNIIDKQVKRIKNET